MEVKEALKWFEWADDVYYCSMPNASPNNEFYKQSKEIKNLLKSLESENKKLKKEYEAYKGMWRSLIDEVNRVENDYAQRLAYGIEQKYLGGGE
jgi:predicted RNase H-like nuclease (RuvC/YqgF family)